MARVTVEDCLENVANRFELVLVASKRARELAVGGKKPRLNMGNDKPTVMALREIAANLIDNEPSMETGDQPEPEDTITHSESDLSQTPTPPESPFGLNTDDHSLL